jgi:hypothetical protein
MEREDRKGNWEKREEIEAGVNKIQLRHKGRGRETERDIKREKERQRKRDREREKGDGRKEER